MNEGSFSTESGQILTLFIIMFDKLTKNRYSNNWYQSRFYFKKFCAK